MRTPEPEGKLDAETTVEVNGPTDEPLDWDAVHWRGVEDDVRRLRQRIFTASQAGDLKKVRNLQKLMLRSRANTLLGVRRVTEDNTGRKTAGIDGQVITTSFAKAALVEVDVRSHRAVAGPARQAGVHPEIERQTAPTRNSGRGGSRAASTGEERVGA